MPTALMASGVYGPLDGVEIAPWKPRARALPATMLYTRLKDPGDSVVVNRDHTAGDGTLASESIGTRELQIIQRRGHYTS